MVRSTLTLCLAAGVVNNVLLPFTPAAVLVHNPKDLYTIWMEYEFGVGGRKAVRMFTPAGEEVLARCTSFTVAAIVIWDKIIELITCAGHTAQTAVDTIYDV